MVLSYINRGMYRPPEVGIIANIKLVMHIHEGRYAPTGQTQAYSNIRHAWYTYVSLSIILK